MSDSGFGLTDEFMLEGMKKYRQASATLVAFSEEIERRLKRLLEEGPRDGWGRFVPDGVAKPKSSRNWSKYPALSARIGGTINGASSAIWITVNWYESDCDYPFYSLRIDPATEHMQSIDDFEWSDGVTAVNDSIRFAPNPDELDLERGVQILLDDAVRFLSEDDTN